MERGTKKSCGTLARRCDPLLVVNGKKKLDEDFQTAVVCERVTSGGVSLPYSEVCFRLRRRADTGSDVVAREANTLAWTPPSM